MEGSCCSSKYYPVTCQAGPGKSLKTYHCSLCPSYDSNWAPLNIKEALPSVSATWLKIIHTFNPSKMTKILIYQSFNYYLHTQGGSLKPMNFTNESQLKCDTTQPHNLFVGILEGNAMNVSIHCARQL